MVRTPPLVQEGGGGGGGHPGLYGNPRNPMGVWVVGGRPSPPPSCWGGCDPSQGCTGRRGRGGGSKRLMQTRGNRVPFSGQPGDTLLPDGGGRTDPFTSMRRPFFKWRTEKNTTLRVKWLWRTDECPPQGPPREGLGGRAGGHAAPRGEGGAPAVGAAAAVAVAGASRAGMAAAGRGVRDPHQAHPQGPASPLPLPAQHRSDTAGRESQRPKLLPGFLVSIFFLTGTPGGGEGGPDPFETGGSRTHEPEFFPWLCMLGKLNFLVYVRTSFSKKM